MYRHMENTKASTIIYTYGCYIYNADELINIAVKLHINCIINLCIEEGNLSEETQRHNILYAKFWEYFKRNYSDITNKHGEISYEKAMSNESIMKGIERIKNGADKGFRIMIIDHVPNTEKSPRFTLVGKYLSQEYTITHIITPTKVMTQEQLLNHIQEKRKENYNKKILAAQLGETGEEIAGLYLMKKNFRILQHNYNLHKGCEIDIIALKDNKIHFIEVKTRSSDKYGTPETAITDQKMHNIKKAALEYLNRQHLTQMKYQIDSIAIIYHNNTDYDLKYYPDIRQRPISRNYSKPYRNH